MSLYIKDRICLYRERSVLYKRLITLPTTESKIQQLCDQLAVRTPHDVEHVLRELRIALEQHIHLAKESLENQAVTLSILTAKARDPILTSSW